jgi:hypothetical protein
LPKNQSVSGVNHVDLDLRQSVAETNVQPHRSLFLAEEGFMPAKQSERGRADNQKNRHRHQ